MCKAAVNVVEAIGRAKTRNFKSRIISAGNISYFTSRGNLKRMKKFFNLRCRLNLLGTMLAKLCEGGTLIYHRNLNTFLEYFFFLYD
jgi:hypothetical protein